MLEALFASASAAKVLLYLANYGDGYASGIARTFGLYPRMAHNQLLRLEAGGILVSRSVGKTKVFSFNPRWAYREALLDLLNQALGDVPPDELRMYYRERRRPRRTGKKF